ncbi:MAG: hypothetical protein JWL75_806 [Parcubacteria group bacterium]|nr:hypothetical protein [Parcubacteria group bacterium]
MGILLIGCLIWGVVIESISLYYVRILHGDPVTAMTWAMDGTISIMLGVGLGLLLIRRTILDRGSYRQAPEFLAGTTAIWGPFMSMMHTVDVLIIIGVCTLSDWIIRGRLFMALAIMSMASAVVIPYRLTVLGGPENDVLALGIFVSCAVVSCGALRLAFVFPKGMGL